MTASTASALDLWTTEREGLRRIDLHVPGIHCANCISRIEGAVRRLPGVKTARVNFSTRRLSVEWHDGVLAPERIVETVAGLGFEARPFAPEDTAEAEGKSATQGLIRCMAVAGFAAMNIMLLSISVWSGAEAATRDLFHAISALIALPAIAYAGRPFFKSAWGALRHGRANMDVPISIGVLLTAAMSLYETLTHGPHAYFDGAVSLLFFLLIGRALDSAMRDRARAGVAQLLKQMPRGATVLQEDGNTEFRPISEIAPGMSVLVAAGERVPVDGVVLTGTAMMDRALVTGESVPEVAGAGGTVLAGTLALDAAITIRVTAAGQSTFMADLVRLMEAAEQGRASYVRLADRVSRSYAPVVHSLAALTGIGWWLAGGDWHQAVMTAVAVLIITCPCALGLAVPAVQVLTSTLLMRRGVLVKDGSALERMAEADLAVLDKTGTLTLGRPTVAGEIPLVPEDRALALALAERSTHPLSRALAAELRLLGIAPAPLAVVREIAGAGLEADVPGGVVRLGRPDWVGAETADRLGDGPEIAFSRPGLAPVRIGFCDQLRPDAAAAIRRLRRLGLGTSILSGDHARVVDRVAREVGIADWRARCSPAEKVAEIQSRQQRSHKVLVVGDGLNDGPALAAGYVSMAPSSASDVGQAAADFVFLGEGLMAVPTTIAVARHARRLVRQNIGLAIGYNVVAVPLAMLGYVTPLIAAIAMSGSSILVIGNALRLSWRVKGTGA
ncbi:heavy metal translocating P-type ATPase [Pedomonas mirosovicensis]|uniref:heavy metal translocating P-type ATPase n=1 Tax=Pedomonas mirosovicensis TaxID=2908641 RepID=UPI0021674E58|nr:heavy metal translocating P-type ATPase [Pedomonas mirosovicensis]MCH8686242.1 cadmium-translocating P-type ATPase [Pedomonas mirosovicensis]